MARKLLNALVPVGLFAPAFSVYIGSPVAIRRGSRQAGAGTGPVHFPADRYRGGD
jgi:hypothetical protein